MADEAPGRILVVDDNRMNRQKLSIILTKMGHQAGLAEDGRIALEMLGNDSYDVILLDILMPEMDGYEVLEQVKSDPTLQHIPVIVISAQDDIDSVVRGIEAGAEDYLPKSFNPVVLRARLNASLQKKKLRDLEKAYLEREMMLRQSEKLATLGRLSAGMAHELNNPAASTRRGARQLIDIRPRLNQSHEKLHEAGVSYRQLVAFVDGQNSSAKEAPWRTDPLDRSDRETELADWLDGLGVEESWEVAQTLIDYGISRTELEPFADSVSGGQLAAAVDWLHCDLLVDSLVREIHQGASRISEIVTALKAYSYMDQAPVQIIDVREGLQNTLTILRPAIGDGVAVCHDFDPDLPSIEAYGGDLNQVWTILIENALDAMGDEGTLTVRTGHDDEWVIIDIEDDGPGIPPEHQRNVFDPFFTTKPPGQGVGLGLSIAHTVIVQKHGGRLDFVSYPGCTRFEARLSRQSTI